MHQFIEFLTELSTDIQMIIRYMKIYNNKPIFIASIIPIYQHILTYTYELLK